MQKSKTFCIKPWIHMATYTTGEALMCCVAKEAAGNLNRDTIEEFWNGGGYGCSGRAGVHISFCDPG